MLHVLFNQLFPIEKNIYLRQIFSLFLQSSNQISYDCRQVDKMFKFCLFIKYHELLNFENVENVETLIFTEYKRFKINF